MAYKFGTYRISLGIDEGLKEKLNGVIRASGLSLADAIRRCIDLGFEHYCVNVSPEVAIKELQMLRQDLKETLSFLRS